ncbi:hypothetical protein [Metabacillus fastidiosus]|uniref:hypothetical protein n=1 Tax=Metabacillus fastidiosus TaxID=1458 RepID=UPI003D2DAF51
MDKLQEISKVCDKWENQELRSRKAMTLINAIRNAKELRDFIFADFITSAELEKADKEMLERIYKKVCQDTE